MDKLHEALIQFKIASKIAIKLGGPVILAVGTTKLVDALDSVGQFNIDAASNDIWQATAAVLRILVDTIPEVHTVGGAVVEDNLAMLALRYAAQDFKVAALGYMSVIRHPFITNKYGLGAIINGN